MVVVSLLKIKRAAVSKSHGRGTRSVVEEAIFYGGRD